MHPVARLDFPVFYNVVGVFFQRVVCEIYRAHIKPSFSALSATVCGDVYAFPVWRVDAVSLSACFYISESDRLGYEIILLHGCEGVCFPVRSRFEVLPDFSVLFVSAPAGYAIRGAFCNMCQFIKLFALAGV